MSDEPTRDLDTSTPTVEEAALYWQWGGHMWQAPERFDRMIAKVKADALREAQAIFEKSAREGSQAWDPAMVSCVLGARAAKFEQEAIKK